VAKVKADAYQAVASRFDRTLLAKVNRNGGQELEVSKLTPRQGQPRRYFDERELAALAESVKAEGVRNPLHVRRMADDQYEVLAGERRYRAALMAELERVPVIVHEIDDATAANLAVLDNLHRADLNPIEETEAILLLVQSSLGVDREGAVTKVRAAANVAKGRHQEGIDNEELRTLQTLFDRSIGRLTVMSFANARLPLLGLPEEIYRAVLEGRVAYTVATPLKVIKDEGRRKELLKQAIEEGLTREQVKRLVAEANEPPVSVRGLEERIKPARHLVSTSRLRKLPSAKRHEFVKLVEEFVARAETLLGDARD
jgi:ParB family chromosome partitioning protein